MSYVATEARMKVNGVSGVFVQARDPEALAHWYADHLGLDFHFWNERGSYGMEFVSRDSVPSDPTTREGTVFVIEPGNSPDGPAGVRIQHRVRDLDAFLRQLASAGVAPTSDEEHDFGRFARFHDPEGNEFELYEPR